MTKEEIIEALEDENRKLVNQNDELLSKIHTLSELNVFAFNSLMHVEKELKAYQDCEPKYRLMRY